MSQHHPASAIKETSADICTDISQDTSQDIGKDIGNQAQATVATNHSSSSLSNHATAVLDSGQAMNELHWQDHESGDRLESIHSLESVDSLGLEDNDETLEQSELVDEEIEDDDELLAVYTLEEHDKQAGSKGESQVASNHLASNNDEQVSVSHVVTASEAGQRIDKLAAMVFTDFSRAQLQGWINEDKLLVDGVSQKPKYRLKEGQTLALEVQLEQHGEDLPENIPLQVVYEDEAVIVINKPVGMVVHPGAGNWSGTLVNALLYHYPEQRLLPRAGLVHRIDKDTSGLLLIAKSKPVQLHLTEQLKDKSVYRHYQCVVAGSEASLKRHRHIDAPIGRHSTMRTKMAVHSKGRDAITHLVNITPLNEQYCLLDVNLETGRTHQIRVHLSHIGYPLVGDKVYGGRRQLRSGLTEEQRRAINSFPRQALHAYSLGFVHPLSGEDIEVTAPLPDDMRQLIEILSDKEGLENPINHFQ